MSAARKNARIIYTKALLLLNSRLNFLHTKQQNSIAHKYAARKGNKLCVRFSVCWFQTQVRLEDAFSLRFGSPLFMQSIERHLHPMR